MVKVNIVLDTRHRKNDGTFPLKISIFRDNKTMYIPLGVYISDENWDKDNGQIINVRNAKALNVFISSKISDINLSLLRLQTSGMLRELSNKKLLRILSGEDSEKHPHYFYKFAIEYVQTVEAKRTKELYELTLKKIAKFCDIKNLLFEDITPSWLRTFDKELSLTASSANTRSIYMRNLRAIFNAAISDGLIMYYPFRSFKIKQQETPKRAITRDEFQKLKTVELPKWQEKYRDIFLLSFYLIGINLVDMASLTSDCVVNGRIQYKRSKTGRTYNIRIEKEAAALIEKYKGKERLVNFFDGVKTYRNVTTRLSKNLRDIGHKVGIEHITYYTARASWATFAAEIDIPIETISRALGHIHGLTVTNLYIRYDYDKIDDANRKVIDYIFEK